MLRKLFAGLFSPGESAPPAEPTRPAQPVPAAQPAQATGKIPLAIGFANLSGDDLAPLMAEDVAALSPLFESAKVVPPHQIPGTPILFVYAHLDENGVMRGTQAGLRQIVQMTKASIVVLASPNVGPNIQKSAGLPGPKANLIFTVDRKGDGFARFFRELFELMQGGKDMLMAWVELAPQGPVQPAYVPSTLFLTEGGRLAFPKQ